LWRSDQIPGIFRRDDQGQRKVLMIWMWGMEKKEKKEEAEMSLMRLILSK
jgi:hypothetical protein